MTAVNKSRDPGERAVAGSGGWQKELADLALLALEDTEVGALMEEAIVVARGALGVELVCVMEAGDDRAELVLRAGTGWTEGEVGERSVSTGIDSPVERVSMAGYAMMSKDPVRAEDLSRDPRFGCCPLMREHEVVSGIMTKIDVGGRLYGVLGAYSRERRSFREDEAYWLRDVSRALGGALARKVPPSDRGGPGPLLGHARPKAVHDRFALPSGLQPRQMEILTLLGDGYLVKEIAVELYCTESNVRKHLKRTYRALGVHGQVAAVARARELGLFDY